MDTKQQPEALAELRERLRSFEADHTPDGWPAVRMRDITALLDDLDNARSDNQVLRLGYAAARLEIESLRSQAPQQEPCPTCAALAAGQATAAQQAAPARDLAAVIKGAADKLDAAVRRHPNAVDTLIHEALEILDGDREPDATPASHGQAPAETGNSVSAQTDSVLEDAARLERERICAAIKAEDDYCVGNGDYMLDSDECIKIVRGEWVRPAFSADAARKQGAKQ